MVKVPDNLWVKAYEDYRQRFPDGNYRFKTSKYKPVELKPEPMVELEELRKVDEEYKAILKKRKALIKSLRKHNTQPLKNSDYFLRPIFLYALKLEHNCYYIGMSRNVKRRFKSHVKGSTGWTKEHKPISIIEVRETGLNSDSDVAKLEDEMTFDYTRLYGTDVVRGGGFCQRKPHWPEVIYMPVIER